MTDKSFEHRDLKLLAEIGFSAAARGLGELAKPIFAALAEYKPDHAAAAIGYATTAIVGRDLDTAIRVLWRDGVNAKHASNEAKAMLLIAMIMSDRQAEAGALQEELIERAEGPAKDIALALLDKVKVTA